MESAFISSEIERCINVWKIKIQNNFILLKKVVISQTDDIHSNHKCHLRTVESYRFGCSVTIGFSAIIDSSNSYSGINLLICNNNSNVLDIQSQKCPILSDSIALHVLDGPIVLLMKYNNYIELHHLESLIAKSTCEIVPVPLVIQLPESNSTYETLSSLQTHSVNLFNRKLSLLQLEYQRSKVVDTDLEGDSVDFSCKSKHYRWFAIDTEHTYFSMKSLLGKDNNELTRVAMAPPQWPSDGVWRGVSDGRMGKEGQLSPPAVLPTTLAMVPFLDLSVESTCESIAYLPDFDGLGVCIIWGDETGTVTLKRVGQSHIHSETHSRKLLSLNQPVHIIEVYMRHRAGQASVVAACGFQVFVLSAPALDLLQEYSGVELSGLMYDCWSLKLFMLPRSSLRKIAPGRGGLAGRNICRSLNDTHGLSLSKQLQLRTSGDTAGTDHRCLVGEDLSEPPFLWALADIPLKGSVAETKLWFEGKSIALTGLPVNLDATGPCNSDDCGASMPKKRKIKVDKKSTAGSKRNKDKSSAAISSAVSESSREPASLASVLAAIQSRLLCAQQTKVQLHGHLQSRCRSLWLLRHELLRLSDSRAAQTEASAKDFIKHLVPLFQRDRGESVSRAFSNPATSIESGAGTKSDSVRLVAAEYRISHRQSSEQPVSLIVQASIMNELRTSAVNVHIAVSLTGQSAYSAIVLTRSGVCPALATGAKTTVSCIVTLPASLLAAVPRERSDERLWLQSTRTSAGISALQLSVHWFEADGNVAVSSARTAKELSIVNSSLFLPFENTSSSLPILDDTTRRSYSRCGGILWLVHDDIRRALLTASGSCNPSVSRRHQMLRSMPCPHFNSATLLSEGADWTLPTEFSFVPWVELFAVPKASWRGSGVAELVNSDIDENLARMTMSNGDFVRRALAGLHDISSSVEWQKLDEPNVAVEVSTQSDVRHVTRKIESGRISETHLLTDDSSSSSPNSSGVGYVRCVLAGNRRSNLRQGVASLSAVAVSTDILVLQLGHHCRQVTPLLRAAETLIAEMRVLAALWKVHRLRQRNRGQTGDRSAALPVPVRPRLTASVSGALLLLRMQEESDVSLAAIF